MASWQSRYAFEPFTEDLRNPSLPEGRSVVRIEPGSAQAARVLGGEGGCWGACMRTLSENGGRWEPGSALDGLMAMAERCTHDRLLTCCLVSLGCVLTPIWRCVAGCGRRRVWWMWSVPRRV